jgi:hypothetical protein
LLINPNTPISSFHPDFTYLDQSPARDIVRSPWLHCRQN